MRRFDIVQLYGSEWYVRAMYGRTLFLRRLGTLETAILWPNGRALLTQSGVFL